jgi:hypothetical protein
MSKLFAIAVNVLLLTSICSTASDCKSGYTTTIVVQDSSGAPIGDVNVTIKLSCGDQATESRKTNRQGEAVFQHSSEEIGSSEVALNNSEFALSNGPSGCTGDPKNRRCVVRPK